jgi:phage tail-like protein
MLILVLAAAVLAIAVSPGSPAAAQPTSGGFALEIEGQFVGWFSDARIGDRSLVLERGTGTLELRNWALIGQKRADLDVVMYSPSGTPVQRWTFANAWPSKWEFSEFDASKNELSVETLEIAHAGLNP